MLLLISLVALGVFQASEGLTMNQAPSNTSAVIGGNATLTCTVSNKQGGETVKWYLTGNSNALTLNDVPVNNDGHYIISGTYNLVIVNVSIDDEAQYTCEAGGSSYYGSLTAVDLPTNMTVYWTTGPSTDGTSNLTCYATSGHPPPSLSWYKNGVALDNSRAVYTGTADQNGYGAAISILPVSLTSGDEGAVFKCEASYTDLNNAMSANLTTTFNAVSGQTSCRSCESLCQKATGMEEKWRQTLTPSVAFWFYSNCGVQSCPDFGSFAADLAGLLKKDLCTET